MLCKYYCFCTANLERCFVILVNRIDDGICICTERLSEHFKQYKTPQTLLLDDCTGSKPEQSGLKYVELVIQAQRTDFFIVLSIAQLRLFRLNDRHKKSLYSS